MQNKDRYLMVIYKVRW